MNAASLQAADLLTLSHWLSPAFPTGAFAWSGGLEAAVARGRIDPDGISDWLEDGLRHGSWRNDAILLVCAARGEDVGELALALASSAERRRELSEQGAAFAQAVAAGWGIEMPPSPYPVAVGTAVRARALPVEAATHLFLQAALVNAVQAAQRLLPLGQSRAVAIVAGLGPACLAVAEEALAGGIEDLGTGTLAAEIAAMGHATLPSRIFRS